MTNDRTLFTSYQYIDSIAEGVNLVLFRGTNIEEIMKLIFFGPDLAKMKLAEHEVSMMRKCAHRYIVKVVDCFVHREKLCLVLAKANRGDLQHEIDRRR